MGLFSWLIGAHERDVGRKALDRLKSGQAMVGDVGRAAKLCGGTDALGDVLADCAPERRKKRKHVNAE